MRRSIRTLLPVLLCICMLTSAAAETCVCPNCGFEFDPAAVQTAVTAPTETEPVAEGTPVEEPAVEEPAEEKYANESSVVVSSKISVSKGIVKITWTDEANNGPYNVEYDMGYGTGKEIWSTAGHGITGKSFYFGKDYTAYLVPGHSYRIRVTDRNRKSSYAVIDVPAIKKKFESGKYNADQISSSIKLEYKAADSFSNDYKTVKNFNAAAMKKNITEMGDSYRVEYTFKSSYGKRNKAFPWFVTISAPNGYEEMVFYTPWDFYIIKNNT